MFENGLKAKMLSCHHTLTPSSTMRSTWFKLLGHDLLSPTFSILGSSSPERTEITQFISKLTQRRSVGEKRSDFFFARALFIQLKLGLKRWRDIGWRAIPPAWREKKKYGTFIPWRRKWQPPPVFVSEKSHGQRCLADYSPKGSKESDMTEQLSMHK